MRSQLSMFRQNQIPPPKTAPSSSNFFDRRTKPVDVDIVGNSLSLLNASLREQNSVVTSLRLELDIPDGNQSRPPSMHDAETVSKVKGLLNSTGKDGKASFNTSDGDDIPSASTTVSRRPPSRQRDAFPTHLTTPANFNHFSQTDLWEEDNQPPNHTRTNSSSSKINVQSGMKMKPNMNVGSKKGSKKNNGKLNNTGSAEGGGRNTKRTINRKMKTNNRTLLSREHVSRNRRRYIKTYTREQLRSGDGTTPSVANVGKGGWGNGRRRRPSSSRPSTRSFHRRRVRDYSSQRVEYKPGPEIEPATMRRRSESARRRPPSRHRPPPESLNLQLPKNNPLDDETASKTEEEMKTEEERENETNQDDNENDDAMFKRRKPRPSFETYVPSERLKLSSGNSPDTSTNRPELTGLGATEGYGAQYADIFSGSESDTSSEAEDNDEGRLESYRAVLGDPLSTDKNVEIDGSDYKGYRAVLNDPLLGSDGNVVDIDESESDHTGTGSETDCEYDDYSYSDESESDDHLNQSDERVSTSRSVKEKDTIEKQFGYTLETAIRPQVELNLEEVRLSSKKKVSYNRVSSFYDDFRRNGTSNQAVRKQNKTYSGGERRRQQFWYNQDFSMGHMVNMKRSARLSDGKSKSATANSRLKKRIVRTSISSLSSSMNRNIKNKKVVNFGRRQKRMPKKPVIVLNRPRPTTSMAGKAGGKGERKGGKGEGGNGGGRGKIGKKKIVCNLGNDFLELFAKGRDNENEVGSSEAGTRSFLEREMRRAKK